MCKCVWGTVCVHARMCGHVCMRVCGHVCVWARACVSVCGTCVWGHMCVHVCVWGACVCGVCVWPRAADWVKLASGSYVLFSGTGISSVYTMWALGIRLGSCAHDVSMS